MAKVNEVKASMGYTTSPSSCATCKHFSFDKELPAWMRGDEHYEKNRATNFTDDQRAEAVRLYESGVSQTEIAKRLGTYKSMIQRTVILNKHKDYK